MIEGYESSAKHESTHTKTCALNSIKHVPEQHAIENASSASSSLRRDLDTKKWRRHVLLITCLRRLVKNTTGNQ